MTFETSIETLQAYLTRKGYSELTIDSYRREILHFADFLTTFYPRITSPVDVKREIIIDYQDYLGEQKTKADRPLSNKTIFL